MRSPPRRPLAFRIPRRRPVVGSVPEAPGIGRPSLFQCHPKVLADAPLEPFLQLSVSAFDQITVWLSLVIAAA